MTEPLGEEMVERKRSRETMTEPLGEERFKRKRSRETMGLKLAVLFLFWILAFIWPSTVHASDSLYAFSCPESTVKGYIHYSVIGSYHSVYKKCKGTVVYDSSLKQIKSVEIKIASASIASNCKWCDDVVRSKRVLDAAVYPAIIFKSTRLQHKGNLWRADGVLELHGIARSMSSRFEWEGAKDGILFLKGVWKFNRKDFNVIWNKVLDHGGIVVGDHVTVDWKVKAHKI